MSKRHLLLIESSLTGFIMGLVKFPKQIYVLMFTEAIFAFGVGIRLVMLPMFLKDYLHLTDAMSRVVYHMQHLVGRFLAPVFGALCDQYIGAFKNLVVCQLLILVTPLMFLIMSIEPMVRGIMTFLAYLTVFILIYNSLVGYFMQPSIVPFHADQFKFPEQDQLFTSYFMWSYWLYNVFMFTGGLISPMLRQYIHCFGENFCFAVPFLVYLISLILSASLLILFRAWYVKNPPYKRNVLFKILALVPHAIRNKLKAKGTGQSREHWLDYADDKYEKTLIDDTKELRMFYMMVPIILYISCYYQQESTWVFLSRRMDRMVGSIEIPPDQVGSLNPFLCFVLIPVIDSVLYPALAKKNLLVKLHHRMIAGGILFMIAMLMSAFIFLKIEMEDYKQPQSGYWKLHVYNPLTCELKVKFSSYDNEMVVKTIDHEELELEFKESTESITFSCGSLTKSAEVTDIESESSIAIYPKPSGELVQFDGDISKEFDGLPLIRHISVIKENAECGYLVHKQTDILERNKFRCSDTKQMPILAGVYDFLIDGEAYETEKHIRMGGYYVVLIRNSNLTTYSIDILEVTEHNTMHLAWILPQYVVIVVGELLYSITFNEFCYTQAPKTMKQCIQGFSLLCSFFGELIIVITSALFPVTKNSTLMFLYSIFQGLAVVLLFFLGLKYKYRVETTTESSEDNK